MLGYEFNADNNTEIPLGMQDYAVGSEKPLIVMQYDDCMTFGRRWYMSSRIMELCFPLKGDILYRTARTKLINSTYRLTTMVFSLWQ